MTFYGVWHIWEIFVVYLSRSQGGKLSESRCNPMWHNVPGLGVTDKPHAFIVLNAKMQEKTFMGFPPLQFDPQYDTLRPQLQQRSLSIFVWDQYFFLKVQHFLYKSTSLIIPHERKQIVNFIYFSGISLEWRETSNKI